VKEEAAIKCDGEGDDDAMRRLGKPLIFKSCMKDHGSATIRRYVRKSSSMTLNEVLCGRQPGFYFYIYIYIYT
jgi:hypothetical protein